MSHTVGNPPVPPETGGRVNQRNVNPTTAAAVDKGNIPLGYQEILSDLPCETPAPAKIASKPETKIPTSDGDLGNVSGNRNLAKQIRKQLGESIDVKDITITKGSSKPDFRLGATLSTSYTCTVETEKGGKISFSAQSESGLDEIKVLHALKFPQPSAGEKTKSFFKSVGREITNVGIVTQEAATRSAKAVGSLVSRVCGPRQVEGMPISLRYPATTHEPISADNDTCLHIVQDWKKGACIASTTYHDPTIRMAQNIAPEGKEPEYRSDCARRQLLPNGAEVGVICDGLDHLHCASGAARQISAHAMHLLTTEYQILPTDSEEVARNKLKGLATKLRDFKFQPEDNWESKDPTKQPATALLLYLVLPPKEAGGQRRLVGINVGDSSLMVYKKDGSAMAVSEPEQRCTIDDKGAPKWNPVYTTKVVGTNKGLAEDSDLRCFDVPVDEGDIVIPHSDGLFDAVPLEHDDDTLLQDIFKEIDAILKDTGTPDSFKPDLQNVRTQIVAIENSMKGLPETEIEEKKNEANRLFYNLMGQQKNTAYTELSQLPVDASDSVKAAKKAVLAAAQKRLDYSEMLAYTPQNSFLKQASRARLEYGWCLQRKAPESEQKRLLGIVRAADKAVFAAKADVVAKHLNTKKEGLTSPKDICLSLFDLADAAVATKRDLEAKRDRLEAEKDLLVKQMKGFVKLWQDKNSPLYTPTVDEIEAKASKTKKGVATKTQSELKAIEQKLKTETSPEKIESLNREKTELTKEMKKLETEWRELYGPRAQQPTVDQLHTFSKGETTRIQGRMDPLDKELVPLGFKIVKLKELEKDDTTIQAITV